MEVTPEYPGANGLPRPAQALQLVAGDVVALEPGALHPNFGEARVEDLVLVTEDGGETLTDYPYGLTP